MKVSHLSPNFSANKAFFTSLAFFLFSFLLLFGLFKKFAPLAAGQAIYYCQALLSNTLITLPRSLPSLLTFLLLLVFATGIFILIVQLIKVRILMTNLSKNKITAPGKVITLSKSLGIFKKVDVVRDSRCLSFCYGFFSPRIILSSKLVKMLTEKQLRAVLIHENYHLKNYDPLKIMLGQIATYMFWFLPVIKDFYDHFVILKEFSADQLVIDIEKSAKNLKLALAKIMDYPLVPASGIVPFTTTKGLEARVLHLAEKGGKPSFKMSIVRLIVSGLVILFVFVFLNIPIYAIETDTNGYAYLICPGSSDCASISSCSKEHGIYPLTFSKSFYYNK